MNFASGTSLGRNGDEGILSAEQIPKEFDDCETVLRVGTKAICPVITNQELVQSLCARRRFILSCPARTTSRDRRTGYTAEYPRIPNPHKMDTRPNPCHRWRFGSFPCRFSC